MRTALGHMAVFEYDDLIAIVDGPQSVGNKDARPGVFFQYAVDILKKTLLRVGVEGRSLVPF